METSINKVGRYKEVVAWEIQTLLDRLRTKHPETFWVTATSVGSGTDEVFVYRHVLHTKAPLLGAFATLLENGVITMDHLIKCPPNSAAQERGPLFKIDKKDFRSIFPKPSTYTLRESG